VYNPQDPAGASRTPGRWHTLGCRILYFCSSLALSILELKANSVSFSAIRKEYHYIDIEIIDNLTIEEAPKSLYTKDWILNRKKTQDFGIGWYKSLSSPILKIRSAVLPTDDNYIINTTHPDFLKLKFSKPKPILLDSRII
jgi:RES domain-containing protein